MEFPTTQEITHIVRNRAYDSSLYIGARFCPLQPEYVTQIEYDILEPSYGMTSAHALGANVKNIDVPSMGTKRFGTAYWKEKIKIDEAKLLNARAAGSYNKRAGRDLVLQAALQLDTRLETRIEWLRWQTVLNGKIVVVDNGVNFNVTYGIPSSNKIDISSETDRKWTAAKSDPQGDIDTWLKLFRGSGAEGKTVYFNSETAGVMAKNPAIRDLLKQCNYAGMLSSSNITQALKMLFPKLEFVVYDGGYLAEDKTFTMFIPDGQLVFIGEYVGEKLMDFVTTLSLHNGGLDKPQPGKFSMVKDHSADAESPYISLLVGLYGLPRVFHPNWIVSVKVY